MFDVLDEEGWKEWLAAMRVGFADELDDQMLPEADKNTFKSMQELFTNTKRVTTYFAPRGIGPTAWNPDERKQTQIRRRFMLLGQTRDSMRVWDVRRAIQAIRKIDSLSTFLNVLRYLDMPHAVAMAAEQSRVRLYQKNGSGWQFPEDVAKKLGWSQKQFQVLIVSNEREP
jgi:hypothetical protein